MSEYGKLKEKGLGRGRPKHTAEQRAQAAEMNSLRQEARRRAHMVLKSKHQEEYSDIYEMEFKAMVTTGETPRRAKRTRK
jgi:hypothetical protein